MPGGSHHHLTEETHCFLLYIRMLDDDASDVLIESGRAPISRRAERLSYEQEEGEKDDYSSLDDEVDSTSSRDMNFTTEQDEEEEVEDNNRLGDDYYERPSDNSSDDNEEGESGARTPQYRHSVTTNWSSSEEETEKYRDQQRSSLLRRSETIASSPDYFQPPSRGDLIN